MKKALRLIGIGAILLLVGVASHAVDPECVGATRQPHIDVSDGTGGICFPQQLEDGTPVDPAKIITCDLTFLDGNDLDLGALTLTGQPGEYQEYPVPRDGVGTAVAICELDGLFSDAGAGTYGATYPVNQPPESPVLLP